MEKSEFEIEVSVKENRDQQKIKALNSTSNGGKSTVAPSFHLTRYIVRR